MKALMISLVSIMIAMNSFAGLDSIKKKYSSDLIRTHRRYLYNLRIEAQRSRDSREIVDINNEISRIENIIDPLDGDYVIRYATGVRTYRFDGLSVLFLEENTKSKFVRNGKHIIINHPSGSVETWEKQKDGTYLVGFDTGKRLIPGKARKK